MAMLMHAVQSERPGALGAPENAQAGGRLTAARDPSSPRAGEPPRRATGGEHQRALRSDEAHGLAWLTWRSNGCEHGIKGHKVDADGSIIEVQEIKTRPRKKPKAVSARQWGRC